MSRHYIKEERHPRNRSARKKRKSVPGSSASRSQLLHSHHFNYNFKLLLGFFNKNSGKHLHESYNWKKDSCPPSVLEFFAPLLLWYEETECVYVFFNSILCHKSVRWTIAVRVLLWNRNQYCSSIVWYFISSCYNPHLKDKYICLLESSKYLHGWVWTTRPFYQLARPNAIFFTANFF